MANEGLQIQIGADVVNVVKSIATLEKELQDLGKSFAAATPGSAEFTRLAQDYAKQEAIIRGVNNELQKQRAILNNAAQGFSQNLRPAVAGTNTTLVNFGRVVQDAPFGLIGIANNIDPLVQSFQNLQRETGSTGGALKSLVAGLAGPAGIAIAVSAVTSALIAFGPQIADAINGISKFDAAVNKALGESAQAAKKAELEFARLSNIINSSAASSARQNAALKEVNDQLSEYGLKINDVATFQKNSVTISSIFVQIKQKEAKATALAALAAEEYAKQLDLQRKIAKGEAISAIGAVSQNPLLALFGQISSVNASGDLKDLQRDQKIYNDIITETNNEVQALINNLKAIPGVTEDFGKATKKVKEKIKKEKPFEAAFAPDVARDQLNQLVEDLKVPKFKAQLSLQAKELEAYRKIAETELDKILQKLREQQDIVVNGLTQGVEQFFLAIANNQDPFKALTQSLKRFVIELGIALLRAQLLKALTAATTGGKSNVLTKILSIDQIKARRFTFQ